MTGDHRQRIDKWLWHARVVRTRAAAAGLAACGHVRVNGQRIDAASRPVREGDVVTIALDRRVRVLKISGFAEHRGPPEAARRLYEDLAPAMPGAVDERIAAWPHERGAGADCPPDGQQDAAAHRPGARTHE